MEKNEYLFFFLFVQIRIIIQKENKEGRGNLCCSFYNNIPFPPNPKREELQSKRLASPIKKRNYSWHTKKKKKTFFFCSFHTYIHKIKSYHNLSSNRKPAGSLLAAYPNFDVQYFLWTPVNFPVPAFLWNPTISFEHSLKTTNPQFFINSIIVKLIRYKHTCTTNIFLYLQKLFLWIPSVPLTGFAPFFEAIQCALSSEDCSSSH